MVCPCCLPPPRCPTCEYSCQIDGDDFPNKSGQLYYGRGEFCIDQLACCPCNFGFTGSYRTQDMWRCCGPLNSPNIPDMPVPAYAWKAGYPASLTNCIVFWVRDVAAAQGIGENCCSFGNIDPQTGERSCEPRLSSGLLGTKGTFRWRLMMVDCVEQSLVDITDDAITKIGVFEGTFNTFESPFDRDCDSITWTPEPGLFDDPQVVCDV